jgi:peroxiredoxin
MSADLACGRLPDVELPLVGGGSINLGCFYGQKLVVFFCPTGDPSAGEKEIETYRALAPEFEKAGTWVIGIVAARSAGVSPSCHPHLSLGIDLDRSAFDKLARSLPANFPIDRATGAAFLIDRDGSIRTAQRGCGHALQALADAREGP